jgi:nucleotide-binding universal stress UspA family protein
VDALIQKIIIPTDFSAASERAARFGCSLAKKLGARVYLIHVVDPSRQDVPAAGRSGRGPTRYLEARGELRVMGVRVCGGADVETEVRRGRVADGIRGAVIAYGADLVVMATHDARSHLLFGSVAEEIIRTVPCPVLVMRDSGQVQVHRHASTSAA